MSLTKASYSLINGAPLNVLDFGADPTGVADSKAAIQSAMDQAKITRQAVFLPAGTYLISDSLEHITPNEVIANWPVNGIQMFGEEGTILKASPSFPPSNAMLNLDGNPTGDDAVVAYIQSYNNIKKLQFDGSGVADRGIRLRANWYGVFEDLNLYDFDGNGLGIIHIRGVDTIGLDDADATSNCFFTRVRVRGSASGFGFWGADNRSGQLTFVACSFWECHQDGVRISTAGAEFLGCSFVANGNIGQNTTGGASIVKSQTEARNRGVSFIGCEMENNFWHEINIDYCFGFVISGCFGSPYTEAGRNGQSWIRCGGDTAQGGVISGNSTLNYSTFGFDIALYDMKAGASNIAIENPVIQVPRAGDFVIDPAASQITRDGYLISLSGTKPSFMTRTAESLTNILNVTGDGTEYTTWNGGVGGFFANSTPLVNFNNGNTLNPATNGTGGRFTAPTAGFYSFNIQWPVTGFDASMTQVEVALIVNLATVTPIRFIVCNKKISGYSGTDIEMFGGQLTVRLGANDTVTAAIKISGGAKVADIYRAAPSQFYWSGFAL